MAAPNAPLPIDEALPALLDALRPEGAGVVLVAPPGAGKTTRAPLALLREPWAAGRRIILLEPRRLAARAAAERMARTLGEPVGQTVGIRVRLGSKVSARTRIEIVTEGVFTRQILDDPELTGVAAVLFDEFHERSLDADLALALALDARAGLREDLRLLVMSATLDGARVASLLGEGTPLVESQGRAHPVETRHLSRDPRRRIEEEMADALALALRVERGSVLAFLPGQREIARTADLLRARLPEDGDTILAPLHGGLAGPEQDAAVQPAPPAKRKIVLATSIAETSLTIEGVRVVVDSGLARVPRFEPDIGLTRLETVRVSRASADQRRGRAGRLEPGICYRLWEEAATLSLPPFSTPEILAADLAPLLLDCAAWGVNDPATLPFLDAPPAPALREARRLLADLGALDEDGRITDEGRALRALPLPPRLACMLLDAAPLGAAGLAANIAALLVERGLGGASTDLTERLDCFATDRSRRAQDTRRLAEGWAAQASRSAGRRGQLAEDAPSPARLLALAYPDRIAKARGRRGEYLMANGRGAALIEADRLAASPFLAVAEIAGAAASARILLAAPMSVEDVEEAAAGRIRDADELAFDRPARALRARRVRRLGSLVLEERPLPVPATEEAARLLARGIADLGIGLLPWSRAQTQTRERVQFLRRADESWPDLSDEALAAGAEDWLAPFLLGRTGLPAVTPDNLAAALDALLPWPLASRLEAEAPTHFEAPTGSRVPIDYAAEGGPVVAIRVQELFGLARHPSVAAGRLPLVLHLTSPAGRPVQITRDLPGFWAGSWGEVRAQMRGRYPKHPWPEDPASAAPTTRAKPRGT